MDCQNSFTTLNLSQFGTDSVSYTVYRRHFFLLPEWLTFGHFRKPFWFSTKSGNFFSLDKLWDRLAAERLNQSGRYLYLLLLHSFGFHLIPINCPSIHFFYLKWRKNQTWSFFASTQKFGVIFGWPMRRRTGPVLIASLKTYLLPSSFRMVSILWLKVAKLLRY